MIESNEVKIGKDEYKCAKCGNIYTKGVSDEEAEQEYQELRGGYTGPTEVVCDDCFKYMTNIMSPKEARRKIEELGKKINEIIDFINNNEMYD